MSDVVYHPLDDKDAQVIEECLKKSGKDYVRVGPHGYAFNKAFAETYHGFDKFQLRSDDVWVVSYPKTGTTWTQELTWCLLNDLDFDRAKTVFSTERVPFLDIDFVLSHEDRQQLQSMKDDEHFATGIWKREKLCDFASRLPSPRCLKSHLPFSLLPKGILDNCKVIYITRNPKDVVVSYFYHYCALENYKGTFPEFFKLFMENLTMWSPFSDHIKEAWSLRNHPNLLFLFYEDLSKDLGKEIDKVATFLGKSLTPEQKSSLMDHLHIDNFKKNKSINFEDEQKAGIHSGSFIRQGKVGGYRENLTPEMALQMEEYIKQEFAGTGLPFA